MAQPASFTVTIKIGVAVGIATACALAIAAYIWGPWFGTNDLQVWRDGIKFILAVVAGGVTAYSATYAALTFRATAIREEQKRSFQILDALNNVEKVQVRTLIDQIESERLSAEDIYSKVQSDADTWKSVVSILGDLEDMAVAIRFGHADEQVLHASLLFIVRTIVGRLDGYITCLRKKKDDKRLYCEITELARCWADGKSYATRQPFNVRTG